MLDIIPLTIILFFILLRSSPLILPSFLSTSFVVRSGIYSRTPLRLGIHHRIGNDLDVIRNRGISPGLELV